ncbi:hypothetical protein Tco_0318903 [Tanacetum coccineum]
MCQTPRQIKRGRDTKIPQSSGPPEKVGDETVHKELGDRMETAATTAFSLEAEQDSGSGLRCQDTILEGVDAQTRDNTLGSGEDSMKLMALMEYCTKLSELCILDFCDKHNMAAYLQKSKGSEEQFWQTASASTLENRDMEITATIDGNVKVVFEASIRRHLKLEDSDGISTLPTTEIFEQLALMGGLQRDILGWTLYCFKQCLLRVRYYRETEVLQPISFTQTHVADEAALRGVDDRHGGAATTVSGLEAGQGSGNINKTPTMPHDSPLLRVHTLGSDEGRMQPNELMELVTKLSERVAILENDLKQTKKTYGAAFTKLIKKVKTLEKNIKSNKARRRAQFVISDDEEEDSFNQGRKIVEIDEDPDISLVQQMIHHDAQTQGRQEYDLEPNFEFTALDEVYTTAPDISTANVPVSIVGAKVSTAAKSLVYIRRSAAKRKDKKAQRLQEQFDEEERQRIASVHKEASTFKPEEWDNMKAQIKVDKELAHKLQAQEREGYSEADKAKLLVELINERKRRFAQQRAQQRRNRPLTQAQQRSYMCNYIKHMGSHTLQQLRGYSFDEIKVLFEATVKRVNIFTPMESDDTVLKVVAGSSKRSAEEELERALWVELKRLFEPDTDDLLELQRYMHDPLTWRLYDTCGVHHVSTEIGLDIFMLVEKDYPMTRGLPMMMLVNKLQVDQHSKMADELLRKIFILANRPRH